MRNAFRVAIVSFCFSLAAFASDYLVKFNDLDSESVPQLARNFSNNFGGQLSLVSSEGKLYRWSPSRDANIAAIERNDKSVAYITPNRVLRLLPNPSIEAQRFALEAALRQNPEAFKIQPRVDKPDFKTAGIHTAGKDPLLENSWGMFKIGADTAWPKAPQGAGIIVAVTDTGVDYNHKDLIHNMWRNPKEIPANGIDDDSNGYVDDIVGWDFAMKDNKPFDITKSIWEIVLKGGNPGHGTHVSGVIGASLNNSEGVAGVAPQVQIMALRFITEEGQGEDANAISAIDYAVKNGANIINASWGGEDDGKGTDKPLREAIARAHDKGVLFVAAAGNGRGGKGFDNDSDSKPMIPSSYDIANVVSVAALDVNDKLGAFSNWGKKSVAIAAPGVKVLSTTPGDKYQDTVIDIGPLKATWDGTSMAAPFVSGALAVIWSQNRNLTADEVKQKLLSQVAAVSSVSDKVATGGRVDLRQIND